MKIIATVSDAASLIHVGGDIERKSCVIEIPDEQLPKLLADYFKWRNDPKGCMSLSFSLLEE